MPAFLRWCAVDRLHHSINTMGCTGGGAYKFSETFHERLGITLRKMDELECLMRGLEFVLQHVVGECYTYKPDKAPSAVRPVRRSFIPFHSLVPSCWSACPFIHLSHAHPHDAYDCQAPSPSSTWRSSYLSSLGHGGSSSSHSSSSSSHPSGGGAVGATADGGGAAAPEEDGLGLSDTLDQSMGGASIASSTDSRTPDASPRLRATSASSVGSSHSHFPIPSPPRAGSGGDAADGSTAGAGGGRRPAPVRLSLSLTSVVHMVGGFEMRKKQSWHFL